MKLKILLYLTAFLTAVAVPAQSDKTYPIKKLQNDLDQLVGMVEAHPAPFRHISEKEFKKMVKERKTSITGEMGVLEFYKLVAPIYSVLKDGHTGVYLPGGWLKIYKKKNGVFPFKVHLSDENRLYVIENHSEDKTIPPGSEILKIDGMPTQEFIEAISPYISFEQEIFRNTVIESNFDQYLLLAFGEKTIFNIEYLSDVVHIHTVNFIPYTQWKNDRSEEDEERQKRITMGEPYTYNKIKDGVGLMKIHSFAIYNQKKYDFFLNKTFKAIKRDSIRSLILDIRGNTGGYPKVVSDLLHCVSEKYFKTVAKRETKVSQTYRDYYQQSAPYINFNQIHFYQTIHSRDLNAVFSKEIGTTVTESDMYNEPPRETNNEFNGHLFLLTNGRSFSASSSLAATVRCYQLGLIVGSETGGTRVFHANNIANRLGNTNLICSMATSRVYTSCFYEEDEGIVPDVEVKPTVQEMVAGQDGVLNYTLRLIKKVERMEKE